MGIIRVDTAEGSIDIRTKPGIEQVRTDRYQPRIPTEGLSPANAARVAQHGLPPTTQSVNRQAWEDANNSLWGYRNRKQELERDLRNAQGVVDRINVRLAETDNMIEVWSAEVSRLET